MVGCDAIVAEEEQIAEQIAEVAPDKNAPVVNDDAPDPPGESES